MSRSRRTAPLVGVGALVVVAGLVVALLVARGGGGGSAGRRNAPAPTTTTIVDPATGAVAPGYRGYVERIESILQQAARRRGQAQRLVTGVENRCQVSPADASRQLQGVVDDATSVLKQVTSLPPAPNAEAKNLSSLLEQALQASIDADVQYRRWMDASPPGCPGGFAPRDNTYASAKAADAKSTEVKKLFLDAFNPVSTRFGLRTWTESDF